MTPKALEPGALDEAPESRFDEFSEQLLTCYQEISILEETSEELGRLLDRETIARAALKVSIRMASASRGAFYIPQDGRWVAQAVEGDVADEVPPEWAALLAGRIRPLIQNHMDRAALVAADAVAPGARTLMAVPLVGQGELVGILALFDTAVGQFESGHAKMVHAVARQTATALNNERHHRSLMEAQEEILVSQKLAAMGEMAAEIGHELNNYLTSILGQTEILQVLLEGQGQKGLDERLKNVVSQVDKMAVLTQGLMRCARQDIRPTECRVQDILHETVAFVKPQNRFDAVQFSLSIPDDLPQGLWDPNQIQQIFLNLFTNAADAMGEAGGTITVAAQRTDDGRAVEVSVSDEGPGVPEKIRRRIFEPRFTTKPNGNGFGLAVCFRVAEAHGGSIRLDPAPERGTRFLVDLPLRPPEPGSQSGTGVPE
jgi:signal transduction histidine kinase